MYSHVLIAGVAALLPALCGCLWAIASGRAVRKPVFGEEFAGELARLNYVPPPDPILVTVIEDQEEQRGIDANKDPYHLHMRGEPAFRIASRLGIGKADAELLIKIQDLRQQGAWQQPEG